MSPFDIAIVITGSIIGFLLGKRDSGKGEMVQRRYLDMAMKSEAQWKMKYTKLMEAQKK